MVSGEILTKAGWGRAWKDRVLHWYRPRPSEAIGRWGTLCGKRMIFIRGPRAASGQFHRRCKTCSKKLARIEYRDARVFD